MLRKKDGQTIYSVKSEQSSILIENGRVIDPVNDIDTTMNVAIESGKIKAVSNLIQYCSREKFNNPVPISWRGIAKRY